MTAGFVLLLTSAVKRYNVLYLQVMDLVAGVRKEGSRYEFPGNH